MSKKADLVVYGTYQSSPEEVPIDLMIDSHGRFCSWDKRPEHLTAFRKQVTLASLVIDLYKCLPAMLGTMKFYVGYRLADGTIVSASSPLEVIGKKE